MITRRHLLLGAAVLSLGVFTSTAWYVWTKGFTRSWRTLIASEFEKQGVELSLRRLTLDPFRGLVAQEVKLLDVRDRRRVLAVVDEMLLGVNYAAALKGEPFLEFVDLREAHLSLPLPGARLEDAPLEISRLNARLFLPPRQLYLARAEAEVLGVQVYATGRLINPQDFAGVSPGSPVMRARVAQLVELLGSLKYKGAPPVLNLEFSGDLQRPQEMSVSARFYAESLKRRNYATTRVYAAASVRGGVVELEQLGLADGKGSLRASATYGLATGSVSARVQSSLAMHDLLHAYTELPLPEELVLTAAPKLDLTLAGKLPSRQEWRVYGHVEMDHFAWRGIPFRSLATDVSWDGGRWSVRDFNLRHSSGTLSAQALSIPGDFRARLEGKLDPQAFAPMLGGTIQSWLSRFDFVDRPSVKLEIRGTAPTPPACSASGEVRFGRATYAGEPSANASSTLEYAGEILRISPFYDEQGEEGQLIFDLPKKEVRLEKKNGRS